ncbi:unnamed protein product [Taenia asiatica]|uniref:Uncharacterized protein n=1 Tax=Taenia asiatica TaxID=60517 RepID=A0A0R3VWW2_TAEAS|nr:unnamed protein product [Taenia asiatica]
MRFAEAQTCTCNGRLLVSIYEAGSVQLGYAYGQADEVDPLFLDEETSNAYLTIVKICAAAWWCGDCVATPILHASRRQADAKQALTCSAGVSQVKTSSCASASRSLLCLRVDSHCRENRKQRIECKPQRSPRLIPKDELQPSVSVYEVTKEGGLNRNGKEIGEGVEALC